MWCGVHLHGLLGIVALASIGRWRGGCVGTWMRGGCYSVRLYWLMGIVALASVGRGHGRCVWDLQCLGLIMLEKIHRMIVFLVAASTENERKTNEKNGQDDYCTTGAAADDDN